MSVFCQLFRFFWYSSNSGGLLELLSPHSRDAWHRRSFHQFPLIADRRSSAQPKPIFCGFSRFCAVSPMFPLALPRRTLQGHDWRPARRRDKHPASQIVAGESLGVRPISKGATNNAHEGLYNQCHVCLQLNNLGGSQDTRLPAVPSEVESPSSSARRPGSAGMGALEVGLHLAVGEHLGTVDRPLARAR